MVPWLLRQVKRNRLAGERIAVPLGKLEVVKPAGGRGAVVDAGPWGLADAGGALPPPAFQVVGVVDLGLADGGVCGGQRRGEVVGPVPAVVEPPLLLPVGLTEGALERRDRLRGL